MARLTWAVGASQDFDQICDRTAREASPQTARTFAREVVAITDAIPDQPHLGAEVPEYGREDVRERLYKNYRLIYRVLGSGGVEMLMVRHGARRLPRTPPG